MQTFCLCWTRQLMSIAGGGDSWKLKLPDNLQIYWCIHFLRLSTCESEQQHLKNKIFVLLLACLPMLLATSSRAELDGGQVKMLISLAFWSSFRSLGKTTVKMTYRSPFSLLWYSGMPSPSNFLTFFWFRDHLKFLSMSKVYVCTVAFSHKIISCRVQNSKSLPSYLGPDFHGMVVKVLYVLLKSNKSFWLQERWKLRVDNRTNVRVSAWEMEESDNWQSCSRLPKLTDD